MNIHERHNNGNRDRRNARPVPVRSERGAALLMVLVISTIALAVMTALIYMITVGTQITGMEKRYRTARDAAFGGWKIMQQFISTRGMDPARSSLKAALDAVDIPTQFNTSASCIASDGTNTYTIPLAAKLQTKSSVWPAACKPDFIIDKNVPTSSDVSMALGSDVKYNVYAKIVNTVVGNTSEGYTGASGAETAADRRGDGGTGRNAGSGVVFSGSGQIQVRPKPYLYTVAVDAENASNPSERAKLSVLYQY